MSKSKFSLRSKIMLLTWPQCSVDKRVVMQRIRNMFDDKLEWAVVATEKHQDGSLHIHALCSHRERFQISTASKLDKLAGKHGNYKPIRTTTWRSMKYVIKDGDYIAYKVNVNKFIEAGSKKQSTTFHIVATSLLEGKSILDLTLSNPSFVLQHLRKMEHFTEKVKMLKRRANNVDLQWIQPFGSSLQDRTICRWLEKNIHQKRSLGELNLWIKGGTGMGKTRLVEQLKRKIATYCVPYDEEWFDDFDHKASLLIVMDEFKGRYRIQLLNKMLGSEHHALRRRNRSPIQVTHRPPVIVLSNYLPTGAYRNINPTSEEMLALERRVLVVELTSRIDLKFEKPKDLSPEEVLLSLNQNTDYVEDELSLYSETDGWQEVHETELH